MNRTHSLPSSRNGVKMKNGKVSILLKMTASEKDAIRKAANDARQTMTAYILSMVLGRNGRNVDNGAVLPPAAFEAVKAMQITGISKNDAQRRIRAALRELPEGTTEEFLHLAFKNGETK